MCLGNASVYVNSGQFDYNVTIEVEPIVARVQFEIKNVPSDVKSISVTLPNLSDTFKFNGNLIGTEKSQTVPLSQLVDDNNELTSNWGTGETIVYPYASETDPMPINVTITNSNGSTTLMTQSSTMCNKGKSITYKTDWNTIIYAQTANIIVKPWTDYEDVDFDLGNTQTQNN